MKITTKTHYEEYEARAQKIGVRLLIPFMPTDKEELAQAFKKDIHLNNIPLKHWDTYNSAIRTMALNAMPEKRKAGWSLADTCCLLKHVAIYHVLGEKPEFVSTDEMLSRA